MPRIIERRHPSNARREATHTLEVMLRTHRPSLASRVLILGALVISLPRVADALPRYTSGGFVPREPVFSTGRRERPQLRTFDLRSISSSATGVEAFRLAHQKAVF